MKKILLCLGFTLILSACSHDHIIRFNLDQQVAKAEPSHEGKSHFFLWGMWQKTDYDLAKACSGRGINAIEAHWTLYDSLMGALTMGIYAPESFSVYCN